MDNDVVKKAPLFHALDDADVDALRASMTTSSVPRGGTVFRQGEQGDNLYVVISGKVKLGRKSTDGRENLVGILGPGEMFGELSLFDPGPRSSSAVAVSDVELIALGNEALLTFLVGRPAVAQELLSGLARRLRRTNDALSDLVFTDVPGRVAKALLDLSQRFGRPTNGGVLVAHDLTQEELAQLVGASRETVNKALADFAGRGWLRLEARAVVLIDLERLERRSR